MSLGRFLLKFSRNSSDITNLKNLRGFSSVTSFSVLSGNRKLSPARKLQINLLPTNVILGGVRGVKTTDTSHPSPVYNEDEKILNKVLEERNSCDDDLPIGMNNPYEKPKKKCILCELGVTPNYKNVKLLYQFVSPYTGLTYEQHITGLCKLKYKQVVAEIIKALNMGLMSNYTKPVEFLKDPKLCDPEKPVKPHKY